ncbi:MAG: CBS domain-containing protein [Calditrichaeota bacterium]|nr:MAG: CBS domain-containing protein [Calditrichota bacterium]
MSRRTLRKLALRLLRWRRRTLRKALELFGGIRRAEHIFMVLSAIVIGLLGAYGAIGFRFLIKLSHRLFFQTWEYSLDWVQAMPWWERFFLPAVGGLLVGPVVYYIAREVRGSGIPEVMEAVALRGGSIHPRVIFAKVVAATLTIGSGGSAGREGPIVQIGSAIGSALGQLLEVSARRLRTFVACGAAAGIAATFNAPIAGALFAVEVIIGDFAVHQFSAIVISSVVATVISRHYLGDFPAFNVPNYELVSPYEFIPYTLLGILAGLTAVLFIHSIYRTQDAFDRLNLPAYLKPAVGGMLVGIIAIFFPQIYGVGYESINDALWGRDVRWLLGVLVLAKIFATALTLGSGGSGGVFAPCLFIGAMLGSLVGKEFHLLYPDISASAGAYALVGMGAVVSGATHAPISAILIIFELTNDYRIIPPLMVSCIIAVLLSTYLKKESIYTEKLVRRGLNIFEGHDVNLLRGIRVREVLNHDVETVSGNATFAELVARMIRSQHQEFFIVNERGELLGSVSTQEIKQFLKEEEYLSDLVIAADLAHPPPARLYLEDNLDLVMHQFGRHNVDELPVLESPQRPRLVGAVCRKDVIDAYNREVFKRDLAGGMHSVVTAVSKERTVELAEGYVLAEIDPPDGFIGKSLRQLNIRARYGVEVILIRKPVAQDGGIPNRPGALPKPEYVIQPGDKLLILGSQKDVETLTGR